MIFKLMYVVSGVAAGFSIVKFGFKPPVIHLAFLDGIKNPQAITYLLIALVVYMLTSFILSRM